MKAVSQNRIGAGSDLVIAVLISIALYDLKHRIQLYQSGTLKTTARLVLLGQQVGIPLVEKALVLFHQISHQMKSIDLRLIKTMISPHVSFDEIAEFERACLKDKRFASLSGLPSVPLLKYAALTTYIISTMAQKMFGEVPIKASPVLLNIGYVSPHHAVYKTFPYFSFPLGMRCIWIYDAWPDRWEEIERFAISYKLRLMLFSSQQATTYFQSRNIKGCHVEWLPEAVTVDDYLSKPYHHRRTDIIQIGRKWDEYHLKIREFTETEGYTYRFEKRPGELVFAGRRSFLEGLADCKISICVPAAVTHPKRSGGLETMTWRYMQSMASKCLIVGQMPQEMRQLFDYTPVVDIDMENPTKQLANILKNFQDYIPLIEKNYEHVSRFHQWSNRINSLVSYIESVNNDESI